MKRGAVGSDREARLNARQKPPLLALNSGRVEKLRFVDARKLAREIFRRGLHGCVDSFRADSQIDIAKRQVMRGRRQRYEEEK
ncbi:MAG: hypothetical protein H0W43_14285 [Chthoniobacterales bacterium]|nr:hypothetical protein [Chthoniobacterales bacterium]